MLDKKLEVALKKSKIAFNENIYDKILFLFLINNNKEIRITVLRKELKINYKKLNEILEIYKSSYIMVADKKDYTIDDLSISINPETLDIFKKKIYLNHF